MTDDAVDEITRAGEAPAAAVFAAVEGLRDEVRELRRDLAQSRTRR